MKRKLLTIVVCSLMLPAGLVAEEETPLAGQMELVDSAYKRIKSVEDAAEGVKEARDGQAACLKAMSMLPALVEKMPAGAARDREQAAFKMQLGELYVVFCKAELMFLEGRAGEVDELVAEFKALKKRGHDRFMEEE